MEKIDKNHVIRLIYCFLPLIPLFLYRGTFVCLRMPGLAPVRPYEPALGGWQMIHTLFDRDYWIKTLSMDNQILPRELEALGVTDLYSAYCLAVLVFVVLPVLLMLWSSWSCRPFAAGERGKHEKKVTGRQRTGWLPMLAVILLLICYGLLRFYAAPAANKEICNMLQTVTDPFVAERFGRVLSIDFGFGPAYYGSLCTGAAMTILQFISLKRR